MSWILKQSILIVPILRVDYDERAEAADDGTASARNRDDTDRFKVGIIKHHQYESHDVYSQVHSKTATAARASVLLSKY